MKVVTLLVVLGIAGSASHAEVELALRPECEDGFSGTATENGATIRFSACPRGKARCTTSISKGDGSPLTEVVADETRTALKLAGIPISETVDVTEAQRAQIERALTSREADLGAKLWPALMKAGASPRGM